MRNSISSQLGFQILIADELEEAEKVLAAPAYEKWHNKGQIWQYKVLTETIHAQRISDGAFVQIFFDLTRLVGSHQGTTFAELGVRPVFMRRIGTVMHLVIPEGEISARKMAALFPDDST